MKQYVCPKCGDIGAHGKNSRPPICVKCQVTMLESHNGVALAKESYREPTCDKCGRIYCDHENKY